jgi:hypothetical protein
MIFSMEMIPRREHNTNINKNPVVAVFLFQPPRDAACFLFPNAVFSAISALKIAA